MQSPRFYTSSSSRPCLSGFDRPRLSWTSRLAMACLVSVAAASHITSPTIAAPTESLVIDDRVPTMIGGHWTMLAHEEVELRKRQDQLVSPTTTPSSGEPEQTSGDGSTVVVSITPPSTATEAPTPLPSPFDSSLAYNFTSNGGVSCPRFINELLNSPTFKACYPLSMMLQSSRSFFAAQKKLLSIVRVLDATCAVNVSFCTDYLTGVAKNLTSSAHCGEDYDNGNPIVRQAYLGLKSYQMLYSATCLQDPSTSMYCFANAVTNLTTVANAYFYYIPLNMTLPRDSSPSCNWCLQETMAIFQSAAADRRQAIASTYPDAAQVVNRNCGPEFANVTLPAAIKVNAAGSSLPSWAFTAIMTTLAIAATYS